jgi:hypothetical protein
MIGYDSLELPITPTGENLNLYPQLKEADAIYFYVTKPTLKQKIRNKFRKWLAR